MLKYLEENHPTAWNSRINFDYSSDVIKRRRNLKIFKNDSELEKEKQADIKRVEAFRRVSLKTKKQPSPPSNVAIDINDYQSQVNSGSSPMQQRLQKPSLQNWMPGNLS